MIIMFNGFSWSNSSSSNPSWENLITQPLKIMGPQQKYTEEEKNILRITFWFQFSWVNVCATTIKRFFVSSAISRWLGKPLNQPLKPLWPINFILNFKGHILIPVQLRWMYGQHYQMFLLVWSFLDDLKNL